MQHEQLDNTSVVASGVQEETRTPSTTNHVDFSDLNYPNQLNSIPIAEFKADLANLFIAFDPMRNKLRFEVRAFPLLRSPLPPTTVNPKPGFISFIGETGNGKSWILRSLKMIRKENHARYPFPLVRPGLNPEDFPSISSDVHLYADSATSESANPILFLDFEGLMGNAVPSSLEARSDVTNLNRLRHEFIQDAYPRIVYAFSNCIVFVVREFDKVDHVAELLTSYSNCGVQESRHCGFKPALFIVFNQMPIGKGSPSDWSVEDTTAAFLASPELKGLKEHYHKIFVINIPKLEIKSSKLVIGQLRKLEELLREQHDEACKRRISFRLDFTADEVTAYLMRALRVFTECKDAVFDWLEQSLDQCVMPVSVKIAEDKWMHFFRYFRNSLNLAPVNAFEDALAAFYSHFVFCVHLHLARHPVVGRTFDTIPPVLEDAIRDIDVAISRYVPCLGSKDGLWCDRIQETHDARFHACGSERWGGTFEHALTHTHRLRDEVLNSLAPSRPLERAKLTIKDSVNIAVLLGIRPVYSCVGCFSAPSTILSCEHAFCEECVEDVVCGKDLHRLNTIKCLFCQNTSEEQHFSPRFLPHTAGYRILSLDGGGVRGMAQIKILQAIETRCFNIPIVHLFDFFAGTSIGGHLVLALTSRASPLTMSNAETTFRDLIVEGFKPKKLFKSSVWHYLTVFMNGSTKYKARTLNAKLKDFFQESSRLLSARNPPSPHVAVTAASHNGFQKRLIPNYTRRLNGDLEEESLILSPEPTNCMPTWVAARCTAAAYPYFKGFEWNGDTLLDGGFAVNCPAELAFEEARCIWPKRTMDTLVSIGTGSSTVPEANKRDNDGNVLKFAQTVIDVVVSSDRQWSQFQRKHKSEMKQNFRLQPKFTENFSLDAVNKLNSISREAEEWLTNQSDQIDRTCNQLIASLFFFKPSAAARRSATQSGSIECRLPPDLRARPVMINALMRVARARRGDLFTVDILNRRSGQPLNDTLRFLEALSSGAELSIPVTFDHLPPIGRSTIDIKLRDIFGDGNSRYSISGCPFIIGE